MISKYFIIFTFIFIEKYIKKIFLSWTDFCLPTRMERDASFAQKKAERATVRSHFRDKYRLPKVNNTLSNALYEPL